MVGGIGAGGVVAGGLMGAVEAQPFDSAGNPTVSLGRDNEPFAIGFVGQGYGGGCQSFAPLPGWWGHSIVAWIRLFGRMSVQFSST